MNVCIWIIALTLFLQGGSIAQTNDGKAELQQRIVALDQAIMKGNLKTLNDIFDSAGVFVTDKGKVVTQRAFLEGIVNKDTTYKSAKSTPDVLRIFGDTAIETGIFNAIGTYKGKQLRLRIRYTCTWVKKGGKWVVISEQDLDLNQVKK